jgi:hypothetical protein
MDRFTIKSTSLLFLQTIAGSPPDNRRFKTMTMRVDPLLEPNSHSGFGKSYVTLKPRVLLEAPFTYIDNEAQVTGRLRLVSTPDRSPRHAIYFLPKDTPERHTGPRTWTRLVPMHERSYGWRKNQQTFWDVSDHAQIKLCTRTTND